MKIKRALATVLIVSTALFCVSCRKGGNTGSDSSGVTPSAGQAKQIDVMKDWKDLNDPREKFPPAGTQTGETSPRIVKTKYETRDIIVADIVPTEMGYAVDPTGVTDSTDGIQQALYDCYYGGGGTVFLPAGNYAITDTITIPQGVTLRGDWQDPDIGTEYGTVFSVWMDSSEEDAGGVLPFIILSCTGMAFKNGIYIFLLRQFYKGIPEELEEAAFIDGCSTFKTFFKIVLPVSVPMMVTVFLLSFCWQWTDTFYTNLFLKSDAVLSTAIFSISGIQQQGSGNFYETVIINTAVILAILPLVILYLFGQRKLIAGIERSGVTG